MTLEAFERIRLRDETITAYETFMRQADASFAESMDKKEDERAKGKAAGLLAVLTEKKGSAPYLEDLGVDSLVIDEAHMFKNSSETVDFKSAKFLSLSPASKRGIDAQAKAWFIRGKSELKDGVLLLTATPITNSPLEIYSMLSLASGHERVNDACLGIRGADNFMEMMCAKENQDDVTIDGVARTTDVFVGLNNVGVLRKVIGEIATIKTAEDVGAQIVVPDREEKPTGVTLPADTVDRLKLYKGAFRWAIDEIMEKSPNRGDQAAFQAVAAHFGEETALIGHPFNLINKMTLLIADPDLDQRATFYSFIEAQADKARDAVEQFNARKLTEDRPRPAPLTDDAAIVGRKTITDTAGNTSEVLKIEVRAKVTGDRVAIDTIDPDSQSAFEAIAEKLELDLDVSVPPKLAAMLENFQHEQASPRGIDADGQRSAVVRQIVFCDILPLHSKIRRLLAKRAGVPAGAIAIITGRSNNSPDEILAVQDGFNASGVDNKYRVVIANEKAEVGINLQKGTQAIHHLSIGWTPDSLEQRNGRGVRQGNLTARVSIYYYDADGTFDTGKRTLVNKKADWIGKVMDVNGGESVAVSGGLTREQLEALIDTVGDADAMRRMRDSIAAKEAEARASSNRDRQVINLDTIVKQNAFLSANQEPEKFVIGKIIGLRTLEKQVATLRARIANPKASATAVAKNEAMLAELTATIGGLRREIEASANLLRLVWEAGAQQEKTVTLDEFFAVVGQQRIKNDSEVEDMLNGKRYPGFRVAAIADSPIHNEWQSEVDMARSMIDEAKASFVRQADAGGAFPAALAETVAQGHGGVARGKPIVAGMFFRFPDGALGLMPSMKELSVTVAQADGRNRNNVRVADAMKAAEAVYPGSAEYDACISRAAELEDNEAEKGGSWNEFSDAVPEVAQRRKTEALAAYSIDDHTLPQPHFPYVISPRLVDKTPVARAIFDAQAAVVKSFYGNSFVVPNSLAVETTRPTSEGKYDALREYALARGMKLTWQDFDEYGHAAQVRKQIEKTVAADALKAALSGAIEDEIRAQARAFMLAAVPWFDYSDTDPLERDYMPVGLSSALADALARVQPAKAVSPTDVVGIRGNTKAWKDQIKRCAVIEGAGRFKWDGDAQVWNVQRAAWDHLLKGYPNAARELELVAATRSI